MPHNIDLVDGIDVHTAEGFGEQVVGAPINNDAYAVQSIIGVV